MTVAAHGGNGVQRHQADEGGRHHDLVHQRVHEPPEIGLHVQAAGDLAIGIIRKPGQEKEPQRRRAGQGRLHAQRRRRRRA